MHWICDSELVLPEDQCERKKLKTKTEAARGGCHMDLILTKDRQRESEMKGGGASNRASSSVVVLRISQR